MKIWIGVLIGCLFLSLTGQAMAGNYENFRSYQVQAGDTVESIARDQLGDASKADMIRKDNYLFDRDVQVGDYILIPRCVAPQVTPPAVVQPIQREIEIAAPESVSAAPAGQPDFEDEEEKEKKRKAFWKKFFISISSTHSDSTGGPDRGNDHYALDVSHKTWHKMLDLNDDEGEEEVDEDKNEWTDLRWGPFLKLSADEGYARNFEYDNKQFVVGVKGSLTGTKSTLSISAGCGIRDKKGENHTISTEQNEGVFYLGEYFTYPEWKLEIGGSLLIPFNSDSWQDQSGVTSDRNPYDSTDLRVYARKGFGPFAINKKVAVEPGFRVGAGRQWGIDDNFLELGGYARLIIENGNLFKLSLYQTYSLSDESDKLSVGLWLNVLKAVDLVKSSLDNGDY